MIHCFSCQLLSGAGLGSTALLSACQRWCLGPKGPVKIAEWVGRAPHSCWQWLGAVAPCLWEMPLDGRQPARDGARKWAGLWLQQVGSISAGSSQQQQQQGCAASWARSWDNLLLRWTCRSTVRAAACCVTPRVTLRAAGDGERAWQPPLGWSCLTAARWGSGTEQSQAQFCRVCTIITSGPPREGGGRAAEGPVLTVKTCCFQTKLKTY